MNIFIALSLTLVAIFGTVRGQLDGKVRLNNQGYTNTNAGVVEVYYNGEWGTVCAGQYWNMDAANVVCRQAGFDSAIGVANPGDYFDRSMDPLQKIWLDDVYCTGDEQTLLSCVDNPGKASCTHDDDAAVICVDVRLVDTSDSGYDGRVEVYNKGQWYGICGDRWTESEAMVVCNMLFPFDANSPSARSVSYTSTAPAVPLVACSIHNTMLRETLHRCRGFFDNSDLMRCSTRAAVSCVADYKKEMDVNDDLGLRAAQLLLQLLQETEK